MKFQKKGTHETTVMQRFIFFLTLAAAIGQTASQDVNQRAVPCNEAEPDGPEGYRTISDVMADQRDEQLRIQDGGQPVPPYVFNFCAGVEFVEFETANITLTPLLDGATFICGEAAAPSDVCVFNGGNNQVLIEDSTVPGYDIESVNFIGITFSGFNGAAVAGGASDTTTVNLLDATFAVSSL